MQHSANWIKSKAFKIILRLSNLHQSLPIDTFTGNCFFLTKLHQVFLFYSNQVDEGMILLEAEEARHCAQVLRKKPGDQIEVVDGLGNWYIGTLTSVEKRQCLVKIDETRSDIHQRPFHLHMAVAPTKNINRLEWFLEKATEFGVDEISLLLCQNSERQKVRTDRLERILIAAMKQSLKAKLPVLHEPLAFAKFMERNQQGQLCIAHCREEEKPHLQHMLQAGQDVCILIGPEGDFTEQEIHLAKANNYKPVSLGESRLRTETAAIAACHIANLINT